MSETDSDIDNKKDAHTFKNYTTYCFKLVT